MTLLRRAAIGAGLLLATIAAAQDALPLVLTDSGHSVHRVVRAQSFTLGEAAFDYDFSAEHPSLHAGTLVVIAADPAVARPRDANMPVLYAGARPVQIVAQDAATGCVVGLIAPDIDLSKDPVFFGSTEPPERVSRSRGEAERSAALSAGIRPRPMTELQAARLPDLLVAHSAVDLYAQAKLLVGSCN